MATRKKTAKAAEPAGIQRLRNLLKKAKALTKSLKTSYRQAREKSRELKKQLRAAEKIEKRGPAPAAKLQTKPKAKRSAQPRGAPAPTKPRAKSGAVTAARKSKRKLRPLKPTMETAPPAELPEPAAEADAPAPGLGPALH
jgi:hypothetical protein